MRALPYVRFSSAHVSAMNALQPSPMHFEKSVPLRIAPNLTFAPISRAIKLNNQLRNTASKVPVQLTIEGRHYNDDYEYQLIFLDSLGKATMQLDVFRNLLGEPAYEDENVLLFHGNSLHMMEQMSPETIPLTVTSPPYNIGKEYEKIIRVEDYIEWTRKWTQLVHNITTPNGAFWLNLGYVPVDRKAKAMPIPYLVWNTIPFFLIQEIVWNYGAGVAGRLFFSPRNEKFLWYVKDDNEYVFNLDDIRDPNVKYPNQKKNGKLKCNPMGKNPTDVWQIAKVTSGKDRASKERTPHPAQFPLDLVIRIILASSNQNDIVFDPFAGSGSLLEAAIQTGRKAIGIEINKDYVSIAIKRIQKAKTELKNRRAQISLFDVRPNL